VIELGTNIEDEGSDEAEKEYHDEEVELKELSPEAVEPEMPAQEDAKDNELEPEYNEEKEPKEQEELEEMERSDEEEILDREETEKLSEPEIDDTKEEETPTDSDQEIKEPEEESSIETDSEVIPIGFTTEVLDKEENKSDISSETFEEYHQGDKRIIKGPKITSDTPEQPMETEEKKEENIEVYKKLIEKYKSQNND
jgi:hypothetical protein